MNEEKPFGIKLSSKNIKKNLEKQYKKFLKIHELHEKKQMKLILDHLIKNSEKYLFVGNVTKGKNEMAKLKTEARNKLKKSTFGLPGERKYPMPDRSHAANAKSRAAQMVKKGKLSKSAEKRIDAKANKILKIGK